MKKIQSIIAILLMASAFVTSLVFQANAAQERVSLEVNKGQMFQLDHAADSIFVANPEVVDVQIQSSKMVHVFAKAFGESNVFVVGKNGDIILSRQIIVEYNTTRLKNTIRAMRPDADVNVSTLHGSLILTGSVTSAEAATDISTLAARLTGDPELVQTHLSVVSPGQVNLRVRIAEVGRDVSKQIGLNWDVARAFGGMTLGIATGSFYNGELLTGTSGLIGNGSIGSTDVNVVVDALDEQGLVTVLAEPNLTAMSGEEARFLVGGEFPIPVAFEDNTIGIEFKEYGVGLSFLPIVMEGGRLLIKVQTEVSQLTDVGAVELSGFTIPALTTRQADTTVNLGSGQSFAIAGLLQEDTKQVADKYPGLADLPILGPLFQSTSILREETELVVIVTPYLVRPVSTQLALPTDGFTPASDRDRVLSGDLHSNQVADGNTGLVDELGRVGPVGPVGFILR